uniref:Uncharacterized protein n=1 Tax=Romanomermis culicivorax TaxID=13658 RepID=A0A915JCA9_ROMCU
MLLSICLAAKASMPSASQKLGAEITTKGLPSSLLNLKPDTISRNEYDKNMQIKSITVVQEESYENEVKPIENGFVTIFQKIGQSFRTIAPILYDFGQQGVGFEDESF